MTHEQKETHIKRVTLSIMMGASRYSRDGLTIENLPAPQRAGTMTQGETYARMTARKLVENIQNNMKK